MKGYTLERLLGSIGTTAERIDRALLGKDVTGVSTDTRSLLKGDVFFAVRGERFDGADYVDRADKAGAVLSVVNAASREKIPARVPVAFVGDTVKALGSAAREYRSMFTGKVIGITGTSGKTTAKELMRAVLESRFTVHATRGNYNNQIGLPLSVFGLGRDHKCAVFEMGMSAPGEIMYLAGIARPDIVVLLNVGPAHMEFFRDMDAIADAKAEILESINEKGTAIVNGDDALIEARLPRCRARIVRFGIKTQGDFRARHVVIEKDGCAAFEIEGNTVKLLIPGSHNVYNALAAYAVGRVMGTGKQEAAHALETVGAPAMRMERIERGGIHIINDSYNANPLSMRAAAEVLTNTEISGGGKKIAVLGDMLELGTLSTSSHREIGTLFGSLGIAYLCLVGKSAGLYASGALYAGMNPDRIMNFENPEDALGFIRQIACQGDVVFVKGSRALGMEKIVAGL
ncbi:UDP-N-acetylmuramoyl-tripeptide--D-alanyl-D-alanine ligase [bacterium]|nr:UDP-N-acetylmuramoyl-tripeptide--D-alanyl-D-alanine ligase [bacterium]